MLVRQAMGRRFETVSESTPLRRAANRLAAAGAHAALVVDEEGILTGIVTVGDIERAAAEHSDQAIGAIASRKLLVARPSQTVAEALSQPGAEALRQLPVVEDHSGKAVLKAAAEQVAGLRVASP